MSRLVAKDTREKGPFKPQVYKNRTQNRSYGQGSYQNRSDSRNRDILWMIDPNRITEVAIFGGTLENMVDRIIEETIEMKDIMTTIETEIGQERDICKKLQ